MSPIEQKLDAIILASTYGESLSEIISFVEHCCINCQIAKKKYKVKPVIVFEAKESNKFIKIKKYFKKKELKINPLIFINEDESGFAACLNYGIKNTTSKYIIRIDTDDRFEGERIINQISEMYFHNLDICSGYMVDRKGKIMKYPLRYRSLLLMTCIGANPIAHPSVCIKREILKIEYNKEFSKCEDLELWLKLFLIKPIKFKCLNYPVTKYDTSRSFSKDKENALFQIKIRLKLGIKLLIFGLILLIGIFANIIRIIIPGSFLLRLKRHL